MLKLEYNILYYIMANKTTYDDRDLLVVNICDLNIHLPCIFKHTLLHVQDQKGEATCVAYVAADILKYYNIHVNPDDIYKQRLDTKSDGMYCRTAMKILQSYGIWKYARAETILDVKVSLYLSGLAMINVPMYNIGTTMWKPVVRSQKIHNGHAMTIVGWNKIGFILKNSWGVDWGENGYTIFPYEDWGRHWVVWVTICRHSYSVALPKLRKKCCILL